MTHLVGHQDAIPAVAVSKRKSVRITFARCSHRPALTHDTPDSQRGSPPQPVTVATIQAPPGETAGLLVSPPRVSKKRKGGASLADVAAAEAKESEQAQAAAACSPHPRPRVTQDVRQAPIPKVSFHSWREKQAAAIAPERKLSFGAADGPPRKMRLGHGSGGGRRGEKRRDAAINKPVPDGQPRGNQVVWEQWRQRHFKRDLALLEYELTSTPAAMAEAARVRRARAVRSAELRGPDAVPQSPPPSWPAAVGGRSLTDRRFWRPGTVLKVTAQFGTARGCLQVRPGRRGC